jgi:hypothetical protein
MHPKCDPLSAQAVTCEAVPPPPPPPIDPKDLDWTEPPASVSLLKDGKAALQRYYHRAARLYACAPHAQPARSAPSVVFRSRCPECSGAQQLRVREGPQVEVYGGQLYSALHALHE